MTQVDRGKVGILVGGGPAPGINGVIHSATVEAIQRGQDVFGIYNGFQYLTKGQVVGIPLTLDRVAYIHNDGGSILRTSRANPTKSADHLKNCVAALLKTGITHVISIGGDDTAFSMASVARFAQENMGITIHSAHVPKTIDNDLPLPDGIPTFGFETARELGARLVMNLKQDAVTSRHWFLVVTMGRKAGHLALAIGKSAAATITLIPEEWRQEEIRLQEVVDVLAITVIQRLVEDKPYGVALLAEGIMEKLSLQDLQSLENVERDEHGHIHLAEVNFLDILKKELDKELIKLGIRVRLVKHILGYELRCAPPCAFDIDYTRSLGQAVIEFLLSGGHSAIITIQGNDVVPMPFAEVMDPETGRTEVRMVDIESFDYCTAYKFMTRLKPHQAQDEAYLARLAAQTNLTLGEFTSRFAHLIG
jgi:6-phosphofructokinase 1